MRRIRKPTPSDANAPPRWTDKFRFVADADFVGLMERRKDAGKSIVQPCAALAVMFAIVNRTDQDGTCWPGIDLLASEASVPLRTLQYALGVLADEGIVRVERRSNAKGHDKNRSTNLYRVVWARLEAIGRRHQTDAATASVPAREGEDEHMRPPHLFDEAENTCDRRTCSDRTGATVASNRCDGRVEQVRPSHFPHTPYKEEPLREPFREPPPQPPGDDASLAEGGGGGDAVRKAAERIVDAYPPTENDVRELDIRAAIDAIEHERRLVGRGDGLITAEDIVAATMAFALKAPDNPLWCRTWLSKRGYHAFVQRERAKVAKAIEAARRREEATARGPAADHASVKAERATTDAALAGLAAHELEELKCRVLDAEPNEFARTLLMKSDARRSPILRERMAAIRRSIAPESAPEFAAAG